MKFSTYQAAATFARSRGLPANVRPVYVESIGAYILIAACSRTTLPHL